MRIYNVLGVAGLVALIALPAPAHAQRTHIGVHGGYNFDFKDALVGGQMLFPVARRLELYPSVDYYFTDAGSLLGINVDLKFNVAGGWTLLYVGGGVNILRASGGGTETAPDFFVGLDSRLGAVHPYAEVRWLLHSPSSAQLAGGLNFTIF